MRNYERNKNELVLKGSHFITYLYHKQKLYQEEAKCAVKFK